MWISVFLKLWFFVESLTTFITPEPILASVLWQVILQPFLCCEWFGTILTMIHYAFVYLHVVCVVANMIETLLTNITIITKLPGVKLHVLPQVTFVGKCLVTLLTGRTVTRIQVLPLSYGICHVNLHLICKKRYSQLFTGLIFN